LSIFCLFRNKILHNSPLSTSVLYYDVAVSTTVIGKGRAMGRLIHTVL
jgi:hypothetical protein